MNSRCRLNSTAHIHTQNNTNPTFAVDFEKYLASAAEWRFAVDLHMNSVAAAESTAFDTSNYALSWWSYMRTLRLFFPSSCSSSFCSSSIIAEATARGAGGTGGTTGERGSWSYTRTLFLMLLLFCSFSFCSTSITAEASEASGF